MADRFTAAKEISPASIPECEPEPSMADEDVLRTLVGIRPFREGGFRIQYELSGGKPVIHNYGHGGAGVTMSWGAAMEVLRLAKQYQSNADSVGVIGGGVIGLTTALLLRQAGFAVWVYSESYTPRTTSDIAGAQWAPSLVEFGASPNQQAQAQRILRNSFDRFCELIGDRYGISIRPNYVESEQDRSFYKIPGGILPPAEQLQHLPFKSNRVSGQVFTTLLIEPPVFMPQLMADCRAAGITLETRKIDSLAELQSLPESLVVNCTGMGATMLVQDANMVPIRGQLVLLRPQSLPWLLSHRNAYIFPRRDAVVLGGTIERGIAEAVNTETGRASILAANRDFFSH